MKFSQGYIPQKKTQCPGKRVAGHAVLAIILIEIFLFTLLVIPGYSSGTVVEKEG